MIRILTKLFSRVPVLIFLITLLFYLSITGGNFWESDSQTVYQLTKSIVDKGQFNIPCFWEAAEHNGFCYSKYGLFSSLSITPFYIIEKFLADVLHNTYFYPGFFSSLTNSFISALLVSLVYLYLIKLNFSKRLSVFLSLLFGFGTYLPAYTKTLFAEPLITLSLYGSLYILIFSKRVLSNFFIAGLLMGLAFLTKFSLIIFTPVIFFYIILKKINWKELIFLLTPIFLLLIIFFFYNYIRFSNIFDSGYRDISLNHPFFYGLYLQIFSPGKSLFLYQPFIIFFVFGLKSFLKKQRLLAFLLITLVIISLIFYSIFQSPTGDLTWGTRYLYPTLPFFIFVVAYFIKNNKSKSLMTLFIASIIISILIQISSVYLSYHRYDSYLNKKLGKDYLTTSYNLIEYSPLIGQWKMIFRINYEKNEQLAWREAFQEYTSFNLNYKIAPPDIFLLRSKKEFLMLLLFFTIEIFLLLKLYRIIYGKKPNL